MGHAERRGRRARRVTVLFALIGVSLSAQQPAPGGRLPGTIDVGRTGWDVKRPVFAAACPHGCPWGEIGEFVRDAMAKQGYEVILCRNCNRDRGPQLVSTAGIPPPLDAGDARVGTVERFDAPVDFGVTASSILAAGYSTRYNNLRLIAKIEDPSFLLVAVRAETGITDLAQIRDRKMPVKILGGGGADRVLAYYGITPQALQSWGGSMGRAMNAAADAEFDVIIDDLAGPAMNPESAQWTRLSQRHELRFLDLPEPLIQQLAQLPDYKIVSTKWGLVRGVDRSIRTVGRSGEAIFARADTPEQAAYDIAKAVDQSRGDLIWLIRRYSIDPRTVTESQGVPLHPGAARYYREAGQVTASTASGPTVAVTGGQVRGSIEDGLRVYRGIPFAAAPIGPLRWQPPQQVTPWSGVKSANAFGPACMQGARTLFPEDAEQSEDCLTLNVWAPGSGQRLPVMVWIYGGGFTMGSTRPPLYSGANFAKQNVVLVSVQYRVGRFGFFAHPAIAQTAKGGLVGNYAILDQIAGLEWVRDNIAAFGGDPANVTIFGESAGGISIHALMASPLARGLFHKAISESGFGRSSGMTLQTAEREGVAFATRHRIEGTGPDAAAALRALSAADVLAQEPAAGGLPAVASAQAGRGAAPPADPNVPRQPGGAPGGIPYPIIDGKVMPAQITDLFQRGQQARVPYIGGGNSYEASLFSFVRQQPQAAFDRTGNGVRAAALYVNDRRDAGLGALDLTTDLHVTEPNRYLARLMAKAGQPAYAYYFSYVPAERRASVPGASHGAELGYVFGTLPAAAPADARDLSRAMSAYWVAFAKTGTPGSAGGPAWEPVTADRYAFMEFGESGAQLRRDFLKPKLDFISDVVNQGK